MTPDEYCRGKAAPVGSSLHYACLFLTRERRGPFVALHAFCREIEDAAGEIADPQPAGAKLAWWRQEIANLFAGNPQHPVTRALAPALRPCRIDAAGLNAIIDGAQMDLEQSRYADFKGLQAYCDRIAGSAQVLAAGIHAYADPLTPPVQEYASRLGTALRLTQVIRDVGHDARRNRIYLPIDELKAFDVPAADIVNARYSDNFARLMRFQAARAESFYAAALAALPAADRRAQRSGLIVAAIQRTVLQEISAGGFRVLTERTSITPVRKFWQALRVWLST